MIDFKEFMSLKESFRRADQRKLLTESFEPQTGIYYFVPVPKPTGFVWDVVKYFDKEYPELQHSEIWENELSEYLISIWGNKIVDKQDFKNAYAGLPRGRVVKSTNQFMIYHGNDSPAKNIKTIICNEFSLPKDLATLYFDDHEIMNVQDKVIVFDILTSGFKNA